MAGADEIAGILRKSCTCFVGDKLTEVGRTNIHNWCERFNSDPANQSRGCSVRFDETRQVFIYSVGVDDV